MGFPFELKTVIQRQRRGCSDLIDGGLNRFRFTFLEFDSQVWTHQSISLHMNPIADHHPVLRIERVKRKPIRIIRSEVKVVISAERMRTDDWRFVVVVI